MVELPPRVRWRTTHNGHPVVVTQTGPRTGRLTIYDLDGRTVRAGWTVRLPDAPDLDSATLQEWRAKVADYLRRYTGPVG